jgi:hypothetical protein
VSTKRFVDGGLQVNEEKVEGEAADRRLCRARDEYHDGEAALWLCRQKEVAEKVKETSTSTAFRRRIDLARTCSSRGEVRRTYRDAS